MTTTTPTATDNFTSPIEERYFEDYVPGTVHVFGSITLTEPEILEFARQFDTQSFHMDPEAAQAGPFQGLIASGWHTTAVMMRLYADHYLSKVASLASPGVDEVRWKRPVRPDDTLSVRATVTEARVSRSKPDRGLVHTDVEVLNQHGETVLTMTIMNMLQRRP
ncbi:acyl dehydratase [Streptomyces griseochromogenes]|uniref:Acyl dehydratase n=1 Tax=Streptomyces griseochromogenes TaxID=68214 RepID=A0A1B1B362_9ACTN|nr:MaoC family dehydratase [Streptomyces griseochromogenes]ANP53258.1 acyl dehydratase [Streptomyces griseochromogenes]MBP2053976.1 acyl dehydratase [Streptomyces griseochromogenes]